jgi:hypothetical protein
MKLLANEFMNLVIYVRGSSNYPPKYGGRVFVKVKYRL